MSKTFMERRLESPDYEIEAWIVGVKHGAAGLVNWDVYIEGEDDCDLAAGILERAAEVLRDTGDDMNELFEKLAAIEHERWADWQKYMHGLCVEMATGELVIPAESVKQWARQINTPYVDLSEKEKESDRDQVRRYWDLVQKNE